MAVMLGEPTRWLLSVLFTVTGLWYLVALTCCLTRATTSWRPAVGAGAHVLMSVAMIAMFWSWGAHLPTITQVTVFTAATAWFAGQVLLRAPSGASTAGDLPLAAHGGCPEPTGARAGHINGQKPPRVSARAWRLDGCYHAAMMAAMVWMGIAMAAASTPTATVAAATTGISSDNAAAMPGMSMPGTTSSGGSMAMGPATGWVGVVCLVLCAGFFAAAAWYVIAAMRSLATGGGQIDSRRVAHDGIGSLMALGMAVALLEMT